MQSSVPHLRRSIHLQRQNKDEVINKQGTTVTISSEATAANSGIESISVVTSMGPTSSTVSSKKQNVQRSSSFKKLHQVNKEIATFKEKVTEIGSTVTKGRSNPDCRESVQKHGRSAIPVIHVSDSEEEDLEPSNASINIKVCQLECVCVYVYTCVCA